MTPLERRTVAALAGLYSFRMLGLFMVLPLLALYSDSFTASTPLLIGVALGAYGLAQALLQIPFGLVSDRIGRRPVIVFGLLLFALGSVVAAQADSIYGLIGGRLLQGAGAIASTVMALVADSTSDEQRTKAMALVGMSIGASFAVALIVGPLLAGFGGIAVVFYVTAGLALLGIAIVCWVVPVPTQLKTQHREAGAVPALLVRSVVDRRLARLNFSVFALHFILMAGFVVLPLVLESHLQIAPERHWLVYLPTLLLSVLGMLPLMLMAERFGRMKQAFIVAVIGVGVAQLMFALNGGAWLIYLAMLLFFVGFNYLEATLPSLISKTVYAGGKGTALGVYSSCQFLGAFAGGAAGGWALQSFGQSGVFVLCALVVAVWLLVVRQLQPPRNLANLVVEFPAEEVRWLDRVSQLRQAPGVAEVLLLSDTRTVYLKVDEEEFDSTLVAGLTV
jgi:MFS family permease